MGNFIEFKHRKKESTKGILYILVAYPSKSKIKATQIDCAIDFKCTTSDQGLEPNDRHAYEAVKEWF